MTCDCANKLSYSVKLGGKDFGFVGGFLFGSVFPAPGSLQAAQGRDCSSQVAVDTCCWVAAYQVPTGLHQRYWTGHAIFEEPLNQGSFSHFNGLSFQNRQTLESQTRNENLWRLTPGFTDSGIFLVLIFGNSVETFPVNHYCECMVLDHFLWCLANTCPKNPLLSEWSCKQLSFTFTKKQTASTRKRILSARMPVLCCTQECSSALLVCT
eukprot:2611250-Amphidinium_carterae.1